MADLTIVVIATTQEQLQLLLSFLLIS